MPDCVLCLADLEAYDPRPSNSGRERRFLCPLCGDGKPKDAAHRSLSLNNESGVYHCYRCKAGGKLRDYWEERPRQSPRERARAAIRKSFQVAAPAPVNKPREWKKHLRHLAPLHGTVGVSYLVGRGLPVEICQAEGVKFCGDWMGRAALVFPIRDHAGELVAAQGRYIDGRDDPKARTVGPKKHGAFITLGVWEAPAVIVTEAPLDALSLAAAGYPALALCGKDAPEWLPKTCAFRRVLLAFDADEAGDRAASELAAILTSYGARAERLRPEGGKDWNELLQVIGRDALADLIAAPVLLGSSEDQLLL